MWESCTPSVVWKGMICENKFVILSATLTYFHEHINPKKRKHSRIWFQKCFQVTYFRDHQACELSPIPPAAFFSSPLFLILKQTSGSGLPRPPWQCFKKKQVYKSVKMNNPQLKTWTLGHTDCSKQSSSAWRTYLNLISCIKWKNGSTSWSHR